MITLLAILIAFGLIIGIHEGSHMLVAKYFGVKVYHFALGFGPVLFSKQIGETSYELRLLPLGGYVQCAGENPDKKEERGFFSLVWYKRLLIALAGPIANLSLGFLIIFVLLLLNHWPLLLALGKAYTLTKMIIVLTLQWIIGLFQHTSKVSELSGPISVTVVMAKSLKESFTQFCFVLSVISLSLGLFNLFPIPGLDGGHLFLYTLEGLYGKPFSSKVYNLWGLLSIVLLLTLMLFVVGMDLWKLLILKSL
jgi:membrane-associated protease RseP (regulator of RpoE activity)